MRLRRCYEKVEIVYDALVCVIEWRTFIYIYDDSCVSHKCRQTYACIQDCQTIGRLRSLLKCAAAGKGAKKLDAGIYIQRGGCRRAFSSVIIFSRKRGALSRNGARFQND